jgi:SHAQKYF class myb-like DNA-binding protein
LNRNEGEGDDDEATEKQSTESTEEELTISDHHSQQIHPPVQQQHQQLSVPLPTPHQQNVPPVKKGPYKQGWSKEEHILFLKGLKIHGKGAWKEIATIVGTRTPTQIQSHAQKYFLRQKQKNKNKRSIHDITMEDLGGGGGNDDDNESDSSDGGGIKNETTIQQQQPPAAAAIITNPITVNTTNPITEGDLHKMTTLFPNIPPAILAQLITLNSSFGSPNLMSHVPFLQQQQQQQQQLPPQQQQQQFNDSSITEPPTKRHKT